MLETDADRLDLIRALGGVSVQVGDSTLLAVYDNEFAELTDTPGVEIRQPALTCCRTRDLPVRVEKDMPVQVGSESFRVKRHEPDGSGMSVVRLKR